MASHTVTGDLSLRPGKANNDSSSSRESSPDPAFGGKRKRSFSPGSVDGSPEPAEPFVNDETPQPEDRPLIRQAVAFGAATSSFSLPTSSIYTAKPPAPATGKTQFLPGQVVKKPRRKKKDDAPYKKQSGRFRLEAYNGTPMESLPGPVIQQGPGPYASAFRGYTDPRSTRSESPALTAPSTLASHSDRSASPAPTRGSANKRATTNASTSKTSGQNRSRTQGRTSSHIPVRLPNAVSPPPPPMSPINDPADPRNNYYRLDYDTGRPVQPPIPMDTSLDFPTAPPMRPAPMQGILQGPGAMPSPFIDSPSPNLVPPPSPRQSQSRSMDPSSSSAIRPPPSSGRMVTILASDIRSGEVDHLLIEVKVPIRPADNPADGYWADAKDLVEQWQGGPARIDGPARVYSHRGMYRQILLRVTSSNEDKYASANVVVRRDRVVEVVIENLPEPGAPSRPQAPPSSRQDVEMTPVSNTMPSVRRTPSTSTLSRLSRLPPPPVSAGGGSNQQTTSIPASHGSPPRENNPQHPSTFSPGPTLAQSLTMASNRRAGTPPTAQPADDANVSVTQPSLTDLHPEYRQENIAAVRRTNKGYESPGSDDDPREVDQAITKLLGVLVLKEDRRKFMDFFSKASVETASNMVSRYIFVKDLMDKYCGQPAPFKSTSAHLVEERHIVEALKIDDPDGRYASNCKETLRLLRLYGKGGERLEDDEVLGLMEETEVPYNAKPAKRLLRLLREIDARWSEQHGSPG